MRMAIVKASYTKSGGGAKASIRYMQHRLGKEGEKMFRTLFNSDGLLGRWEAYRMVDEAEQGSLFFRFIISPDPTREDTHQDLSLRDVTEQTMLSIEDRLHTPVAWIAAIHQDHAPHRHVHIVAVVPHRLQRQDFLIMRQTATDVCHAERHERDLVLTQQEREREEAAWERSH